MAVWTRLCLDYKLPFAAASLLARSTELRRKINLLFKAGPDKDSHQASLGVHLFEKVQLPPSTSLQLQLNWELGGAVIPFPSQMSLSWFPRVFSSSCCWHITGCYMLIVGVQTCLYSLLLCSAGEQSPHFSTGTWSWEIWRDVLQQIEVTLWNLTGWPLFSVQKTNTADSDTSLRRAAKRKPLSKIFNALSLLRQDSKQK